MLIHWPDPDTPFAETMDALNRLKKEGKILHISVSNFSVEQMKEAGQFGEIEAYQPHYSMVNRDYNVVMGIIFLSSLMAMIGRLFSDILYTLVDPRIKFS